MSTSVETPYVARGTLTVRVELVRQLRRRRTLVAFGLAIALPLIVVAAVKLGPQSRGFGDGDLDLNILIRSAEVEGDTARFRTGAGIVFDSVPERELEETRAKARGMFRALGVDG